MELLTGARMRAIEAAAIESGEVTGLELMKRAGRGAVDAVLARRPELAAAPGRALVLCGPGGNGGDGFVMARHLRAKGWDVDAHLYGAEAKLPPDAAENMRRWSNIGVVEAWNDSGVAKSVASGAYAIVVDALFGIGLKLGMPEDTAKTSNEFMSVWSAGGPSGFVAIDMPSGICSDSGANLGGALRANLTVTFHRPKIGQYLGWRHGDLRGGADWCGEIAVVDIGLERRRT